MPPHCSSYARSAASPSRRKPTKWPFAPPLTRSLLPRVTCSVRWRRTPRRRIAPTWPPRRAPVQAREGNATRLLRRHPRARVGDHSLLPMHEVPRLLDLSACLHRDLGMLGVLRLAQSLWQAWCVPLPPCRARLHAVGACRLAGGVRSEGELWCDTSSFHSTTQSLRIAKTC